MLTFSLVRQPTRSSTLLALRAALRALSQQWIIHHWRQSSFQLGHTHLSPGYQIDHSAQFGGALGDRLLYMRFINPSGIKYR
jgi:hypothetical protein